MSLSIQGMTAYMRDLGREIARALPTRNLVIVNGHGGNKGILEALAQDLRADFGLNVCILHPAAMAETDANAAVPEIHGGKDETSMMLAIAPQQVRRDQIATLKNPPRRRRVRNTILPKGVTWPWTSDDKRLADTGVIGDAHAASAEYGQRIVDHVVETAGGIIKQLLDNQRRLQHRQGCILGAVRLAGELGSRKSPAHSPSSPPNNQLSGLLLTYETLRIVFNFR